MKKNVFILATLFIAACFHINAQEDIRQDKYLFNKFMNGKVLMKNKSVVVAPLNYDWIKQEMNYLDNEQRMILQGLETIDTVYIGDRKFIPHGKIFLELHPVNDHILYIGWKAKIVNKGKKGAMGMTSHAITSRELDVANVRGQGIEKTDLYVFDSTSDNSYYIRIDDKLMKFNSEKSLLKLFPKEKTEAIQSYMKAEKIDMKKLSDVIKVTNYCFGVN